MQYTYMQITEIQNVYTQQEIANFSLLKDAFLQQNALYNNREALYELVRQTPKVLLMEYTEQANKYILFAMLENRVFKVLDHIKNGDISPVKAVSLRGNSYRSGSLFQFGFGNYDTPEFETRIFNIVHYTLMPPIPNFKNVFLDKCVEALMFKPQTNPDSARDFVFLLDNLLMLLKETPMESLYSNFITLPLLEFGDFLTYDDNTILDRIQDFEGFGQDSMMWNVISKIQSIKKYAGEMIQYMISRENADDLPIEKFQDIVESAENFLNRIGWQNYHSKFILDKFMEGHISVVTSVSFNHDGTKIVSGSRDRTVRVWNSETGECVLTLEGHTDFVNSVSFNHDGTKIVSGSSDKTVRVWNSEIGECLLTLEGNTDYVTSVSFNHDGTKIISGSRDRTVRVWIGSLITNEDSDTEVEYTETEIQDSDTEYEDSATERESENEASNEDPVLNLKAVLGVMYDLQQFRNYTLPETRLVMEINDEDCDIGDADTKKEYPVKINVSANGVEWDSQGTSADAKLYVFCASDLKTWLNTHTGSNTFGIDSVYLENQDLHNKNPFNNKIIYGVQYLTQEEIDQEMTKYDSTEGEEDLKSQLYAQIVELRLKIIKLENEIKKLDNDKSDLERRKRFLEIQLRQKQTTLNIMRQPTSIKLKL